MVELLNKVSDSFKFFWMYINGILFFVFFVFLPFFFFFYRVAGFLFFSYFCCCSGSCFSASIRLHCVDCETLGQWGYAICYCHGVNLSESGSIKNHNCGNLRASYRHTITLSVIVR